MTATTETTIDELRERLAQEETEAEAAERKLGAAALDGPNIKTVSKGLIDAQAAIQTTKATISEVERREQAQAEHSASVAAAQGRREAYEWFAAYADSMEKVVATQAALREAYGELRAQRVYPRVSRLWNGFERIQIDGIWVPMRPEESDLDLDLLRGTPRPPHINHLADQVFKDVTVERCRELRARAAELAAAEQQKLAELEEVD